MQDAAYTPEQLTFAERISRAIASVPPYKQPILETIVEAVLIGAGIDANTQEQPAKRLGA